MVGHAEELQLLTFCENWENVEPRVLCTRRAFVGKSDLIDIEETEEKQKKKNVFLRPLTRYDVLRLSVSLILRTFARKFSTR